MMVRSEDNREVMPSGRKSKSTPENKRSLRQPQTPIHKYFTSNNKNSSREDSISNMAKLNKVNNTVSEKATEQLDKCLITDTVSNKDIAQLITKLEKKPSQVK